MKILNFGSLNIDYTYRVDHILVEGETQSAIGRHIYPGGKGLNQSIALARAGADVWHAGMIGKVDGAILLDMLTNNSVHLDYLREADTEASGHTVIQVDQNGKNCILVYGGSNQKIAREHIDSTLQDFGEDDYLILQNEINDVAYIIKRAAELGLKIVLNPSPVNTKIDDMPLDKIDFFIVNEIEAEYLVHGTSDQERMDYFVQQYPHAHLIMTVGARGAYYAHEDLRLHCAAHDVPVVDTTAAGDTFTGYFISSFSQGKTALECLQISSAASALAVSRSGASSSIPKYDEVTLFLSESITKIVD